jgi:hypothetical protein
MPTLNWDQIRAWVLPPLSFGWLGSCLPVAREVDGEQGDLDVGMEG